MARAPGKTAMAALCTILRPTDECKVNKFSPIFICWAQYAAKAAIFVLLDFAVYAGVAILSEAAEACCLRVMLDVKSCPWTQHIAIQHAMELCGTLVYM